MDELETLIISNLQILGKNFNDVETNIMEYLVKVESVISKAFKTYEEIQIQIKNNKLSMLKISEEAVIARQTIYNNNLVYDYCKFRIKQFDNLNIENEKNKLKQQITELERTIEKMKLRDVNEQLLLHKIKLLEEELILCKKENTELHKKYYNVTHERIISHKESSNSEVLRLPQK